MSLTSSSNRPLAPNRDDARERAGERVADHVERFQRWQWFFLLARLDFLQATNGQAKLEAVSRAKRPLAPPIVDDALPRRKRALPPPIVRRKRALPPPIADNGRRRNLPPPISE